MPIKFRCQHCRQFLGISRAKAGEVFDCPTCGWTLRVPELDGTVKPLPGPGLDMGDSKLAQALDELASMEKPVSDGASRSGAISAGGTGVEGRVIDDRKDADDDGGMKRIVGYPWESDEQKSESAPVDGGGIRTMAEPIDLPPLPAPQPIGMEPRFRANKPINPDEPDKSVDDGDSATGVRPWRSTAQAGNSWKRLLAAAEFGVTEGDSTDEPVKEADPIAEPVLLNSPGLPDALESSNTGDAKGLVRWAPLIWAGVGIIAVVFAGGFWIGRFTTLPVEAVSLDSSAHADSEKDIEEASADDAPVEEEGTERLVAFRGRLTFRTDDGDRKADQGARIIVLPVERKGTAKLSVTGLRSGDQAEDQQFVEAGIRTLGGDVATTTGSGEFEIKLPGSGQFYILALSNSLSRDDEVDTFEVEQALTSYFERPAQLLGQFMHHFEEVRYSGAGVTPWDFSFGRP